jgi:hypothetical protein
VIDKKHVVRLTSDDANAVVVLYATWPGEVALILASATEICRIPTPTRIVIPLRRNPSGSRLAMMKQTLLGPEGLPRGEVFLVHFERPNGSVMGIFAVPRETKLDLRVESRATCAEEIERRTPPRA